MFRTRSISQPTPPGRVHADRVGLGRQSRRARQAGFNLIQLMLSLAIGSIVVSVAVPKVKQSERISRSTIIVADLRTFASAFEGYAQERGGWPDEQPAGKMPPEMNERLGSTSWLRTTPIGGQYNWDSNQLHAGTRYKAVISISETDGAPFPVNEEVLLEIDKLVDDGSLTTGNFRIGVNNDPIFILQQ